MALYNLTSPVFSTKKQSLFSLPDNLGRLYDLLGPLQYDVNGAGNSGGWVLVELVTSAFLYPFGTKRSHSLTHWRMRNSGGQRHKPAASIRERPLVLWSVSFPDDTVEKAAKGWHNQDHYSSVK